MPRLTVIQGPDRGKTFEVDGKFTAIGRDPSCEVLLHDASISRHQATLEISGDRYVLKDAGSANGTFVNGKAVTEAPLKVTDEIRIGQTVLKVKSVYVGSPSQVGRVSISDAGAATSAPVRARVPRQEPPPVLDADQSSR